MFSREENKINGKLRNIKRKTISEILGENGYKSLSVQHFMLEKTVNTYVQIDGRRTVDYRKTISQQIENENYDAVFCIYQAIDHSGHKFGPFHKNTMKELALLDNELEKLDSRMRRYWGEYLMVLSSDHSMTKMIHSTKFNPLKLLSNLGLQSNFYTVGNKVPEDIDCVLLKYPTVELFLVSDLAKKSESKIINALKKEEDIDCVLTKEDMRVLGNPDYADIGFYFKSGTSDLPQFILNHKSLGHHGTEYEDDSTISYYGKNVSSSSIDKSALIDIVPTTLDYLEIECNEIFDGISQRL